MSPPAITKIPIFLPTIYPTEIRAGERSEPIPKIDLNNGIKIADVITLHSSGEDSIIGGEENKPREFRKARVGMPEVDGHDENDDSPWREPIKL